MPLLYSSPSRTSSVLRCLELERVEHPVGPRVGLSERRQPVAQLDQLEDRGRVVRRAVDKALLGEGRDDDGRHARARAPAVALGWRHMVPEAAVLVVGDDHRDRVPDRAGLDTLEDVRDVRIARLDLGTARVLVYAAARLIPGHSRQRAAVDVSEEILQILEVLLARLGATRIVPEEDEGLVVKAEPRGVDRTGLGLIPAARVPDPGNALVGQSLADR